MNTDTQQGFVTCEDHITHRDPNCETCTEEYQGVVERTKRKPNKAQHSPFRVNKADKLAEALRLAYEGFDKLEKIARDVTKDNGTANLARESKDWARQALAACEEAAQ
jgi:hypothetical protein